MRLQEQLSMLVNLIKSAIEDACQRIMKNNSYMGYKEKCPKCGQVDRGQTGEYPCPECGLPLVWDEWE